MLGPVSSAAQGHSRQSGGAIFPIGVGLALLVHVWVRFFRSDTEQPKAPIENTIGLTLIFCTMIALGYLGIVTRHQDFKLRHYFSP